MVGAARRGATSSWVHWWGCWRQCPSHPARVSPPQSSCCSSRRCLFSQTSYHFPRSLSPRPWRQSPCRVPSRDNSAGRQRRPGGRRHRRNNRVELVCFCTRMSRDRHCPISFSCSCRVSSSRRPPTVCRRSPSTGRRGPRTGGRWSRGKCVWEPLAATARCHCRVALGSDDSSPWRRRGWRRLVVRAVSARGCCWRARNAADTTPGPASRAVSGPTTSRCVVSPPCAALAC